MHLRFLGTSTLGFMFNIYNSIYNFARLNLFETHRNKILSIDSWKRDNQLVRTEKKLLITYTEAELRNTCSTKVT